MDMWNARRGSPIENYCNHLLINPPAQEQRQAWSKCAFVVLAQQRRVLPEHVKKRSLN